MKLLTNSRKKAAHACARLHHLSYELGYRPARDAAALDFGTAAHAGLEARLLALRFGSTCASIDLAIAAGRAALEDPFEAERLEAMLAGYCFRWPRDDIFYEVLEVECEFRAPLVNPDTGRRSKTWHQGGKMDGIVLERETGRVLVLEHKTAGGDIGPGSVYWQRLRIDSQISMYLDGARSLGYDAAGVLYDVLGKPDLRPLKATSTDARKYKKDGTLYANQRNADETPREFGTRVTEYLADHIENYQRAVIVRIGDELVEMRRDLWDTAHLIDEGRHPKNPDACLNRYGSACAFLPYCGGEASLSDPTRYRQSDNVHPELKEIA